MSDLLKKIIKSQAIKEGRFYARDNGKVYERIVTTEDSFTGYFQDAAGTLFTEEGWDAEKKRLFKEFEHKKEEELKRAQEKRSAAVIAKKEHLKEEVIARGSHKKKYTKIYLSIIVVLMMVGVLVFGVWERNTEEESTAATEVVPENVEASEMSKLFGNAIITGDGVNLRSGPSLDNKIITSLGKMGERVEVIALDSSVSKWEKIRREDGTQGWVYDLYIKKLDSLDY